MAKRGKRENNKKKTRSRKKIIIFYIKLSWANCTKENLLVYSRDDLRAENHI